MVTKTTQTLKGFRDFLPEKMVIRSEAVKRLISVFERYGFSELQTPALEYKEVLTGKYGEEAEKLMYLFKDQGERDVGLRYDLTVPLARVMASNRELPLPFKRYQIQPVWRAEKPQMARYREIYQCDIDIVGSSSPLSDVEIIAVVNDSLKSLNFESFKIRINSRQVLFSVMKDAKIDKEKWLSFIQSLDKLDKKSKSGVERELSEKGATTKQVATIFKLLEKAEPDDYLKKVIDLAKNFGVNETLVFDANMSRGLDYYTGPIFETVIEKPKIGSITGGGRYDELLKDLGGPDLPAVGTSIGLDRVVNAIDELNLLKDVAKTPTKALVTIFSEKYLENSIEIADMLRKSGINCEIYTDETAKLQKQLKYADKKGIPWAVIIGPEEILKGQVVLKDMNRKKQESIPTQSLLTRIK